MQEEEGRAEEICKLQFHKIYNAEEICNVCNVICNAGGIRNN